VPRKASEHGACKDLKGHIFTIGSGNKGKDGDMLCTSKEKMATYIVLLLVVKAKEKRFPGEPSTLATLTGRQ
jgi:hypothetical protein